MLLRYFLPPYRVIEEVKSDAHILVVCVYSVCSFCLSRSPIMLADFPALIISAASAYILAATSNPYCGRCQIVEYLELPLVIYGNYLLSTSSGGVWSFSRSVLCEVLPTFRRSFLLSLGHVLFPLLSFVVWFVSFEELTCAAVAFGFDRRQIQLKCVHNDCSLVVDCLFYIIANFIFPFVGMGVCCGFCCRAVCLCRLAASVVVGEK